MDKNSMIFNILKQRDVEKVIDYLNKLASGKKYTVEIKVKREKRSIEQNRLYWLWLTCIMDETGNEKEVLHEFFKQHILGKEERYVFDDKYPVVITESTTKLDTMEMTMYLNRIQQFVNNELGIVLPNPNDLQWEEFYSRYKNFI